MKMDWIETCPPENKRCLISDHYMLQSSLMHCGGKCTGYDEKSRGEFIDNDGVQKRQCRVERIVLKRTIGLPEFLNFNPLM